MPLHQRKINQLNYGLTIGLFTAVLCSALNSVGFFAQAEMALVDTAYDLRGESPWDPSIVLVDVDDTTLREFGWPLPRHLYANLILVAFQNGAKVIGYDVLFLDEKDRDNEILMGRASKLMGPVVYPSDYQVFDDDEPNNRLVPNEVQHPITPLAEASAGLAHLGLDTSIDGTVRRVPLQLHTDPPPYSLALRMLQAASSPEDWKFTPNDNSAEVSWTKQRHATQVPLDRDGLAHINFQTVRPDSSVASLLEVLSAASGEGGLDLATFFKDKYVIVGASAAGLGDRGSVPQASDAALVLAHVAILDNLLNDRFTEPAPTWFNTALILIASIAMAWLALVSSATMSGICGLVLTFLLLGGGYFLFSGSHLQVAIAAPLVAGVCSSLGANLYRRFVVEADERLVRQVFGRFVAPDILEQLIADPTKMHLQGQRVELSILFSDIAGYTSLSNTIAEDELIRTLRDYLNPMSECILKNGGTLDKIMGDGIMAFFGDPTHQPDHAIRAVRCARDMHVQLEKLNERLAAEGRSTLNIRIGIATGTVYSGNFGSAERIEYTVIGPAVNLAARLESKARPGTTLVSAHTFSRIRDEFHCRLVTKIALKGYEELAKLIIPLYDEIDYPKVINKFDSKDERKMVTEILMSDLDLSNVSSLISDCILTLKAHPIKEGIKDTRIRIRELEEKGADPSEAIIEVAQLQQELKLLSI